MTRLLDARTSQNASIAGSMNGAGLTANQNVLIGQIGLTTAGSQGPIRECSYRSHSCFKPASIKSRCNNTY